MSSRARCLIVPQKAEPTIEDLKNEILSLEQRLAVARGHLQSRLFDELSSLATPKLTPREAEVLELVKARKRNKEIATIIHVSERTVKYHVSSLLVKMSVLSRADLWGI